ncbi:MAG TPA: matrixin family metalloprotease [Kofleriaceae bacterium]|nr:matrixin family metalloprotease [Kofleriaceae bacterium]
MQLKLLAGAVLTVATAAGCVDEPNYGSTQGLSFEEFKARTYREPGTGLYVLDWDMPVSGDAQLYQIWEATQQGTLAVMNINGQDIIWTATQRKQLTYCISNTFGANKQTVIDAMAKASDLGWEKMADVNFTYVSTQDGNCNAQNTQVLFDVNPVNANGQYLARAFFPNSTRAERNVLIDTTAFQPGGTGNVPLPNIISHELGHTLGFRHEHIRPEANATQCAEDTQFRGLTTYDAASVMHYPQCNGTSQDLAFTQKDKDGVVALYGAPANNPSPMTQVTAPADNATVGPNFDVVASIIDTDLMKAELKIDGTLKDTLTAAPYTFHISALAVGAHTLEITATDGAGQKTTQTLHLTVAQNGGGGGNGSGGGTGTGGGDGLDDSNVYGGCDATGGGGAAGGGLLALIAFASLVRRRRTV